MSERPGRARRDDLAAETQQLVDELRRIVNHTRRNLRELAVDTHASRSSWSRFLHGEVLIPESTITRLIQVAYRNPREARVEEAKLLALRELALQQRAAPAEKHRQQSSSPEVVESGAPAAPKPASIVMRDQARTIAASQFLVAGAVVVSLLFGVTGEPAPSSAQSAGRSCYAETCTGRDAKALGCDRAARTMPQQRGSLEIRYSRTCSAAWLRMRNPRIGDALELANSSGTMQRITIGDRTSTHMIPARPGTNSKAASTTTKAQPVRPN